MFSIFTISTFSLFYNLCLGFFKTSLIFRFFFVLYSLKLSAASGFWSNLRRTGKTTQVFFRGNITKDAILSGSVRPRQEKKQGFFCHYPYGCVCFAPARRFFVSVSICRCVCVTCERGNLRLIFCSQPSKQKRKIVRNCATLVTLMYLFYIELTTLASPFSKEFRSRLTFEPLLYSYPAPNYYLGFPYS